MSDVELARSFHVAMLEEGGRLDRIDPPEVQRLLAAYRGRMERILASSINTSDLAGTAGVHADFVNNLSVNAVAMVHSGTEMIGINAGVFIVLDHFFAQLLSHPDVLSSVGDPSVESATFDDLSHGISVDTPLSSDGSYDLVWFDRRPRDRNRLHRAALLGLFAFDYLLMHEFGHITGAHLDYLTEHDQHPRLFEFGHSCITGEERRLLELDADCFAAVAIANKLQRTVNVDGPLDFAELLFNSMFSVCVLYALYDQRAEALSEYEDSGYPHPDVRFTFFLITLREWLEQHRPETLGEFDKTKARVINEARRIWERFRLPGLPLATWTNDWDTVLADAQDLFNGLERIRPALRALSLQRLSRIGDG